MIAIRVFCPIKEGDCFAFIDGSWSFLKEIKNRDVENSISILITRVADEKIDVEGCDGDKKYLFSIYPLLINGVKKVAQEMLKEIRVCGKNKVSVKVDQMRFIMQAKDWLVKKGGKWRVVKRAKVERFATYEIDNEDFFVFEAIEIKDRCKYLKGKMFNYLRTDEKEVLIPLSSSFKKRTRNLKK